MSDGNFEITEFLGMLHVYSPNGGESWVAGSTYTITWMSVSPVGDNVKIDLLFEGGTVYAPVIGSTPNTGSFTWLIPTGQSLESDYCRIRVSTLDGSIYDVSDTYFTITSP
jgi:hypothetical protein